MNIGLALQGLLNGAVGDHLVRTQNPLAIPMGLVAGNTLALPDTRAFQELVAPTITADSDLNSTQCPRKIVLLVHGLMATEEQWHFSGTRNGTPTEEGARDYGLRFASLNGSLPLYLRYNSGLGVAVNGASLSALLEDVVRARGPRATTLHLLTHSMGGLVARSACHFALAAKANWLAHLRQITYIGTPHHGAPLERVARNVLKVLNATPDPVARAVSAFADARSHGVKDLGDGLGHPIPLLPGIQHDLIAGTLTDRPFLRDLFGDTMVSVASATGRDLKAHVAPNVDVRVHVISCVSHTGLMHNERVWAVLRDWATHAPGTNDLAC